MNPKTWQRVKTLLEECLALAPEDRAAFLAQACGDDKDVREEVESLLESHEKAGDEFLERDSIPAPTPEEGMRLGPWRVEAEIGQGGMGRIFRAVRADGQYDQRVAIKILRRGMDTDSILNRFQSERQILASLNHPNIARLIDGGATEDGRPFFVMEFIDGKPLDRYIELRKPEIPERLRLFQAVCEAIQYAHQRFVVHRDIKPANILVTADGVPKLVDFGIAKLLVADADVTVTAARMMTPAYASPEQISGDTITTASDVYSLGVVLYRLLTGKSPYDADETLPADLRERVQNTEPKPPSMVAPEQDRERLRGDLDNIVLKALEKDPARRYGSAEQLSQDIQRYLSGEPVLARPQTWSYRTVRFVGRHRLLVGLSAVALVALIGGFAATLWQYRIAQAERRQAQQRFERLRSLANSVINEFHDSIVDISGTTEARALMLRRATEYLDGLAAEAGGDTDLRLELAAAYRRVGGILGDASQANLGDEKASEASYRKAIQILEGVSAADQGRQDVRMGLARSYLRADLPEKAIPIAESLAKDGGSSEREILADAYYGLADERTGKGDFAGALEMRQRDLAIRKEILAGKPRDSRAASNFALVSKRIGGLLIRLNRLDEAYGHYSEAKAIEQQTLAGDPDNATLRMAMSFTLSDMGHIRSLQKRYREALEDYDQTIVLREKLFKDDPKNSRARASLASALWRRGSVLLGLKRVQDAVASSEKSVAILTAPDAPQTQSTVRREELATARYHLALAYRAAKRDSDSVKQLGLARDIYLQLWQETQDKERFSESMRDVDRELQSAGKSTLDK